ncbi:YbaN family protein [Plastorhodobacter daqingensis]|uniref:YbaN family protein n=1 Tax=Plastorhodobacter daqingensis TaxID=1387281 RepID=A0ABW2UFA5_9RHOB
MRWFWAFCGLICLALGVIGAALPLLPTVPFLLLAAFCFARSSERLHHWLITHPRLGPPIESWQRNGAISRRAKRASSLAMTAALGLSVVLALPLWVLLVQGATLACVALFIWSRPEG